MIPKHAFEALNLREGDFLEVTFERGNLRLRPKRLVDIDGDVLAAKEVAKVTHGEAEIKAGLARPWQTVKRELAR